MFDYSRDVVPLNLSKLISGFDKTLIIEKDLKGVVSNAKIVPYDINVLIPTGIYIPINPNAATLNMDKDLQYKFGEGTFLRNECVFSTSMDYVSNRDHCTTFTNIANEGGSYITTNIVNSSLLYTYSLHCVGKILYCDMFKNWLGYNIRDKLLTSRNRKDYVIDESTYYYITSGQLVKEDPEYGFGRLLLYLATACTYFIVKNIFYGDAVESSELEIYYAKLLHTFSEDISNSIEERYDEFNNYIGTCYSDIAFLLLRYLEALSHNATPSQVELPNGSSVWSYGPQYCVPKRILCTPAIKASIYMAAGKPILQLQSDYQSDCNDLAEEIANAVQFQDYLVRPALQGLRETVLVEFEEMYIKPIITGLPSYISHIEKLLDKTLAIVYIRDIEELLENTISCYSYLLEMESNKYRLLAINCLRDTDITYLNHLKSNLVNHNYSDTWEIPKQVADNILNLYYNNPVAYEAHRYQSKHLPNYYLYSYPHFGMEYQQLNLNTDPLNPDYYINPIKLSYSSSYISYNKKYLNNLVFRDTIGDTCKVQSSRYIENLLYNTVSTFLGLYEDRTRYSYKETVPHLKKAYKNLERCCKSNMNVLDADIALKHSLMSLNEKVKEYLPKGNKSCLSLDTLADITEVQLERMPVEVGTYVGTDYTEILLDVDVSYLWLFTQICDQGRASNFKSYSEKAHLGWLDYVHEILALIEELTGLYIMSCQDKYDEHYKKLQSSLDTFEFTKKEETYVKEFTLIDTMCVEEGHPLSKATLSYKESLATLQSHLRDSMYQITSLCIKRQLHNQPIVNVNIDAPENVDKVILDYGHKWVPSTFKLRFKIPTARYFDILQNNKSTNRDIELCLPPLNYNNQVFNALVSPVKLDDALWKEIL